MSTPSLVFPQSLTEKYRPTRIADFLGLERPKKVLSAFLRRPAPGAWLFVGPSGVGKSTMALALANELQAELHKIPSQKCNAQSIEDTVRRCWYAPMTPGGFHVVLADEADQMTDAAQLALLSKLSFRALRPGRSRDRDGSRPPPQIRTGATNASGSHLG